MEPKLETPNFRENDEATKEYTELSEPTLSSSKGSEDWEKISEDWVSLFMDPALLDEHSRYPPRDLEGCSQFDTTLLESNDHFSSQDLMVDSLLLHSIDEHVSNGDLVLECSSNIGKDSFGKDGSSSPQRSIKMNLTHPKKEPQGHTGTTSSTNSLTQLIGGSNSRIDINLWKNKEYNPNLLILLKEELNGDISSSSNSSTFPLSDSGTERKFAKKTCLLSNQVHDLSCSLQCEDGEICPRDGGHEVISCLAQEGVPSTSSQLEFLDIQHLYSIGNAIKVGLLGRLGDMEISAEDIKESKKPINQKFCEAKSFGLHNDVVLKDLHCDYNDVEWKRDGGDKGDDKQSTQLIYNLKSSQLLRHRISVHIDELENKLQTMMTRNAELNVTISQLTEENVNLRREFGYYCPTRGVYSLRQGMSMHILPMRPYSGIVARRTMYSSRQMPHVPIAQNNIQTSTNSLKRTKSRATKEEEATKETKHKVVGIASMVVVGLLFLVMMFGSFEKGFYDFASRVDDFLHFKNVQVPAFKSWNENASSLNNSRFSKSNSTQGWTPLEPGEYGPECEGIPSIYTQVVANKLIPNDGKLAIEDEKSQANASLPKIEFESSTLQSIDENEYFATTSSNYLDSMKVHAQLGNELVLINTNQSFAPSTFIPSANGLAQIIRASDKVPKKLEKKHKSGLKKRKEKEKVFIVESFKRQAIKSTPIIKDVDNLVSSGSKILPNTSRGAFVTTNPFSKNKDSIVKTNNPILPVLRGGASQQWIVSGLHDLETNFVARKTSKTIKSQPHVVLHIDNLKNEAAIKRTFYSFTPYDMAPRGPLNSWFFSGLSTEPITWKRNISDVKDEVIFLPIKNKEKLESLMAFRDSLQPFTYAQFLQKKATHSNTCSVPTLSQLFWATTRSNELAKANLRQCLAIDRLVLNRSMCTKLYQFDITTTSPIQVSKTKTTTLSMMAKTIQGNPYNVTFAFNRMHVVSQSQQDPFQGSLPPILRFPSWSQHENGIDPRVENIVQGKTHSQNLRNGVLSMVVSVLAEDNEDCKKKGTTKGFTQIFVVVLIDNEKYVTYSCMIPVGGPQAHVVAE